ncbi:MAG: DUF1028 domain-containing protein [Spiribacter salinus]|uniref:DUF1028 domain-containing protein n=1 Tax=Spiribacter salinus TaxID=1335746 RepID=A0A540VRD2_9GAMM|nr:MAG: DUF1028 domain-containing protein [Spiribacter salinus]
MTYSIAARCPDTGAFGIAMTSSSICVPSRCAWVSDSGVIATQNVTDPQFGPLGLSLLVSGVGAQGVAQQLKTSTPYADWRQIAVVDRHGMTALHSGAHTLPTFSEAYAPNCVALGNLLVDTVVPHRMIECFNDNTRVELAERLLRVLEAGAAAGGEGGNERSAGLEVCAGLMWSDVDLRIDWDEAPLAALRGLWNRYRPQRGDFIQRAVDPEAAPSF